MVEREEIGMETNTIILNLLAGKIPNRENNRILVETGSMSNISGQHFRVESRQQRRFGRRYCKISLYGGFVVGREGFEPSANGLKVRCSTAELTAHFMDNFKERPLNN